MTTRVDEQKETFRRMLAESRAKFEAALRDMDPQQVVYAESGWRVKDIIAHITAWELEVTTSLRAYNEGREYTIPGYTTDDAYNADIFRQYQHRPMEQLRADWGAVRAGMVAAIRAIPATRFEGQIMCPWNKYSAIDGIVRDMVNHEAEHLDDILSMVD